MRTVSLIHNISISDIDAENGEVGVMVESGSGMLSVDSDAISRCTLVGLTVVEGLVSDAVQAKRTNFTGKLADVNNALKGLICKVIKIGTVHLAAAKIGFCRE